LHIYSSYFTKPIKLRIWAKRSELLLFAPIHSNKVMGQHVSPGPALADAGPNARRRRGAPLSSRAMTSSCSVNRDSNF